MHDPANPFMHTLSSRTFMTGLGVGAVVTLLVSSPAVQRALFRTVAKTTNAITSGLAEAKERFHDAQAEVYHDSTQEEVEAGDVCVEDIVVVGPGEMIPVDGQIVSGVATVNLASITGESVPVDREAGGLVLAGGLSSKAACAFGRCAWATPPPPRGSPRSSNRHWTANRPFSRRPNVSRRNASCSPWGSAGSASRSPMISTASPRSSSSTIPAP